MPSNSLHTSRLNKNPTKMAATCSLLIYALIMRGLLLGACKVYFYDQTSASFYWFWAFIFRGKSYIHTVTTECCVDSMIITKPPDQPSKQTEFLHPVHSQPRGPGVEKILIPGVLQKLQESLISGPALLYRVEYSPQAHKHCLESRSKSRRQNWESKLTTS